MKNFRRRLGSILIMGFLSLAGWFCQMDQSFAEDAAINIVKPITLSETQGLNFGRIIKPGDDEAAVSYTINSNSAGELKLVDMGGTQWLSDVTRAVGHLEVSGAVGLSFTVMAKTSGSCTKTGIDLMGLSTIPDPETIISDDPITKIFVGGTMLVKSVAQEGKVTCSYEVIASY